MKQGQFPVVLNLTNLNGQNGFKLNGETSGDQSGYSVSTAGDINGDGFDDLLIGAFGQASYTGCS
jgi:FG-GAP repeat